MPDKPLANMTLPELVAERDVWQSRIDAADGWGASLAEAAVFRDAAAREIALRERMLLDARVNMADPLFPPEREQDPDYGEIGFCKVDLCRAVQVWFHCQSEAPAGEARTVGRAAEIFRVSPRFLAACLDQWGDPFFFALPGDDPARRILECDGA